MTRDYGSQDGSSMGEGCLLSVPVVAGTIYWRTPGADIPEEALPSLYSCVLELGQS